MERKLMVSVLLPAIPWSHSSSDFGSVWTWETTHFIVTVNGGERSCYYVISSKSMDGEPPKPFSDGQAATFEQAELMIREAIGKGYSPNLGYQHFAGSLATTFIISTGVKIDLGAYSGHEIEVKVFNKSGDNEVYTGIASIQHYDLVITKNSQAVRIPPSYIQSISFPNKIVPVELPSRLNRIISGYIEKDCNGKPGFIEGTVEHYGLLCPIHEKQV